MKKIIIFAFLLSALFLLACAPPTEKQCTADADCAPAACCHATDALNEQYAPSCNGVLCTMECRPGTIDCGQGTIKCVQNECTVVLNQE